MQINRQHSIAQQREQNEIKQSTMNHHCNDENNEYFNK